MSFALGFHVVSARCASTEARRGRVTPLTVVKSPPHVDRASRTRRARRRRPLRVGVPAECRARPAGGESGEPVPRDGAVDRGEVAARVDVRAERLEREHGAVDVRVPRRQRPRGVERGEPVARRPAGDLCEEAAGVDRRARDRERDDAVVRARRPVGRLAGRQVDRAEVVAPHGSAVPPLVVRNAPPIATVEPATRERVHVAADHGVERGRGAASRRR